MFKKERKQTIETNWKKVSKNDLSVVMGAKSNENERIFKFKTTELIINGF